MAMAQKANITAPINSTTVGNNTTNSNSTQTAIPTTAFDNLSPQCQAAVRKYNGTTPQGCSNIPQQSTNFNLDSKTLDAINTTALDGICVSSCQSSVKQMATEISTACKNDDPTYQYLSAYMAAYFDLLCVKDGPQYCVVEEIQVALSALQQGNSANALIANTTFACTKCFYQQLTALDGDIKSFPGQVQQEYAQFSGIIKNECTGEFQKFASDALSAPVSFGLGLFALLLLL
ncbi:hypothetical protein HDV01_002043 [Terramyces sp. JEL0728]|nr:hypothetical protein HDV01_002043 [Terramyces sp. JEL0728]